MITNQTIKNSSKETNYLSIEELSHKQKVNDIISQLTSVSLNEKVYIQKGGVHHFAPLPKDNRFKGKAINIHSLNSVLSIDTDKLTCEAEPGITFSEVVKETLPYGLLPAVVPELKGITLGGAISGCSLESMSFKYGGFHDTCLEYEVITTDGKILNLSDDNYPNLFEMMHGSYGTLCILTKIKFKLIKALPYIKIKYVKFNNLYDFWSNLYFLSNNDQFDFIDAIIHNPNQFVLCLGNFVQWTPYLSNYTKKEIYYISTLQKNEDYLSTYDYCFRYDTECHWITKTIPFFQNKIFRSLFGKQLLGSTNLLSLTKSAEKIIGLKKRPDVVCDIFIPAPNFFDFFEWYEKEFNYFPLWICPYKAPKIYPWINNDYGKGIKSNLFIDCAVYGKPNSEKSCDYSELLEEKTIELNGIKTLISRNHFTKESFWQVYNKQNYFEAKKALDPKEIFPDIYNKFHKSSVLDLKNNEGKMEVQND